MAISNILRPLGILNGIWHIELQFGILNGNLVYFVVIWCIFFVLVCCTEKIWQPCLVVAEIVFACELSRGLVQSVCWHPRLPILCLKFWQEMLIALSFLRRGFHRYRFSMPVCLFVCMHAFLSVFLPLYVCVYDCLSVCLFFLFASFSVSVWVGGCLCLCLSVSLFFFIFLSLCVCLTVFLSVYAWLFFCFAVFACMCVCFCVFMCVCVSGCQFFWLCVCL
jgi:hypothetical protein